MTTQIMNDAIKEWGSIEEAINFFRYKEAEEEKEKIAFFYCHPSKRRSKKNKKSGQIQKSPYVGGAARPDLARYYNIDVRAFMELEWIAEKNFYLNPEDIYDYYGVWGVDPADLARAWFACGARPCAKFYIWANRVLAQLEKFGRVDGLEGSVRIPAPNKKESASEYKGRVRFAMLSRKVDSEIFHKLKAGDKKRLSKLLKTPGIRMAAIVEVIIKQAAEIFFEEYPQCPGVQYRIAEVNWKKAKEIVAKSNRKLATDLRFARAWNLLFNRAAPYGLGDGDPHPVLLFDDKVAKSSFVKMAAIVKRDSENDDQYAANIKSAYHIALTFRDWARIKRWLQANGAENENFSVLDIHDAFVDAGKLLGLKLRDQWIGFLIRNPELKWKAGLFALFEKEFDRIPRSSSEFERFAAFQKYENIRDKKVAEIAASLGLDEEYFEDYQEFFEKNPPKKATMLPYVRVEDGDYVFEKLDDHDKVGPFLGLLTDCCQHLHNAGSACAEAGWRDAESGFYVVRKNGKIVAQSWAWRGKEGELVFDSIEGLGNVNVSKIAVLYKKAAQALLGKLGVSCVLVGDTEYGLTPDVKEEIGSYPCTPAEMLVEVSYSDAWEQWLLAE